MLEAFLPCKGERLFINANHFHNCLIKKLLKMKEDVGILIRNNYNIAENF